MATKRPTPVAMSASAMPPMTLSIWTLFWPSARSANATMTPMTVPSRPTKGALLPRVPSSVMPRSSSRRRLVISPSIAASSAAGPPWAQRSDALSTSASTVGLASSRLRAASRSPSSSRRHSSSPSSSPPVPRLRKYHQRSTIAPMDATDSASSRYMTHELPSIAILRRYLTITACSFAFQLNDLLGDEEARRPPARRVVREQLARLRVGGLQAPVALRLVDGHRESARRPGRTTRTDRRRRRTAPSRGSRGRRGPPDAGRPARTGRASRGRSSASSAGGGPASTGSARGFVLGFTSVPSGVMT